MANLIVEPVLLQGIVNGVQIVGIAVTNAGQSPETVDFAGFQLSSGKDLRDLSHARNGGFFPRKLHPGEQCTAPAINLPVDLPILKDAGLPFVQTDTGERVYGKLSLSHLLS